MKPTLPGTSLVVQWLKLHSANGGGPGQGTRTHIPQLRVPHASAKTWHTILSFLSSPSHLSVSFPPRRHPQLLAATNPLSISTRSGSLISVESHSM